MAFPNLGNPRPGHTRDSNAPGIAVGKSRYSTKRNKQTKPVKGK